MILLREAVLAFAIGFAISELPITSAAGAEFAYFRSNTGVQAGAAALPGNLDAPEVLRWRVPLDSGHSTPILHGSKIFLTTYRADSKELAAVALDEATGKLLWRSPIVRTVEQTHPIGNRQLPRVRLKRCTFFGSAGLLLRSRWETMEHRMGPFRDEWAGSSPI
jgi:hypothetical protein